MISSLFLELLREYYSTSSIDRYLVKCSQIRGLFREFFKGFICIHILVTMDPRHTDAEDEQFLLNMIAEGQGDVPEQADDGSNTDIYLNISGDVIEPPSIQDDAAGEQSANVHITTILICNPKKSYLFVVKIIFSSESI